jgi:epoxyqueuosine reductase
VSNNLPPNIEELLLEKARELGAALAGIADAEELRNSPSYKAHGKCNLGKDVGSVIVMALWHPPDKPEMDYWDVLPGKTPGNRRLFEIGTQLNKWLKEEYQIESRILSYTISKGGTFLKDAGALAGLGIIGKNNLLITPEFGPRVRLGALAVNVKLKPSSPLEFNPCHGCEMPCRAACPQDAFSKGEFNLPDCREQMDQDERSTKTGIVPKIIVKYCRECELSCIVGGE